METFTDIKTERLLLRRLRTTDASDLFEYFSNERYAEFSGSECFTEVEQAENLIRIHNERIDTNKGMKWAITIKDEDRVIGTCGFENWQKNDFKAEVGFGLSPEYWQKGIMRETLSEVIKFGFNNLDFNRIEALTSPGNIRSRKLLEKCNFKEEGYLRDYYFERGEFLDFVIFSVLKKEYMKILK
ncbi:GNAT family N-acetyltransferase [Rossellomorea vietnamensis]|uniref:GNAT family N-acetyltransferase n=1 Tax=Rossellomorea vietnamensis TaxID=218284 RepID=A0A5D4NRB5_9BACI|nr:GNAT family protein [Rossellomorea vietnamensis]TYS15392.1 GNAT family N-acetyltransferase [Rossellomorea vietnamensis]